jgi:hypothetical protein
MRLSIVLSLALAATAADVAGQQLPTELFPPPGTDVRILFQTDAGMERVSGRLNTVSEDELVLARGRAGRDRFTLPADVVLGLETAAGRDHLLGAGKGLLIGTVGSALLVGAFGALVAAGEQSADCCTPATGLAFGAIIGAVVGAPTGTLVGLLIGSQRWERVW